MVVSIRFVLLQALGASALLVALSAPPAAAQQGRPAPRSVAGDPVLVFVSDTQRPIALEELRLRAHGNEAATDSIFASIARERDAAAVFHLGDITEHASSVASWERIERDFALVRGAGLPVYPVAGNHEFLLFPDKAKTEFLRRFPWCRPCRYVVVVGKIAVVLLDSNVGEMDVEEHQAQQAWYDSTLTALDADPAIRCVIVGCHHSPYTNSTIVAPSTDVQRLFVPRFTAARKTALFVSGHAHACEHFRIGGKDFLVVGGGGGLLQPLLTGSEARWEDRFPVRGSLRPFHYMRCRLDGDSLRVQIVMLRRGGASFGSPSVFDIPVR